MPVPARLRAQLGRQDMKMLFNINAEFAHSLDQRPIALRAKSAVFSSLADAILVSGRSPARRPASRTCATCANREGCARLRQYRREHRQSSRCLPPWLRAV